MSSTAHELGKVFENWMCFRKKWCINAKYRGSHPLFSQHTEDGKEIHRRSRQRANTAEEPIACGAIARCSTYLAGISVLSASDAPVLGEEGLRLELFRLVDTMLVLRKFEYGGCAPGLPTFQTLRAVVAHALQLEKLTIAQSPFGGSCARIYDFKTLISARCSTLRCFLRSACRSPSCWRASHGAGVRRRRLASRREHRDGRAVDDLRRDQHRGARPRSGAFLVTVPAHRNRNRRAGLCQRDPSEAHVVALHAMDALRRLPRLRLRQGTGTMDADVIEAQDRILRKAGAGVKGFLKMASTRRLSWPMWSSWADRHGSIWPSGCLISSLWPLSRSSRRLSERRRSQSHSPRWRKLRKNWMPTERGVRRPVFGRNAACCARHLVVLETIFRRYVESVLEKTFMCYLCSFGLETQSSLPSNKYVSRFSPFLALFLNISLSRASDYYLVKNHRVLPQSDIRGCATAAHAQTRYTTWNTLMQYKSEHITKKLSLSEKLPDHCWWEGIGINMPLDYIFPVSLIVIPGVKNCN